MRHAVVAALTCAATIAHAEIELSLPIDCTLGTDCHIQQFVDHDDGPTHSDFRCGTLTYDGHKGTDFALDDLAQMTAGVDVLAAADGVVRNTRDGMQDQLYVSGESPQVAGKECGNGVVLVHPDGYETQYCHLKQDSISVQRGDSVKAGDVIGQVGLSGKTQFPHLHLSLRQNGAVIDPFDPDGDITCNAPSNNTLWVEPLDARPGGLIAVGFSSSIPELDGIKSGTAHASNLDVLSEALVIWAYAFGVQENDQLKLQFTSPDDIEFEQTVTFEKTQAVAFRASGRIRRAKPWPSGRYEGVATLLRAGEIISIEANSTTIEP